MLTLIERIRARLQQGFYINQATILQGIVTSDRGRSKALSVSMLSMSILVLNSCTSKANEAEKRYNFAIKAGAPADEICARGKAWADVYLEEGNEPLYRETRLNTYIGCRLAQQDERKGIVRDSGGQAIEADNLDAPLDANHSIDKSTDEAPAKQVAQPQNSYDEYCAKAGIAC